MSVALVIPSLYIMLIVHETFSLISSACEAGREELLVLPTRETGKLGCREEEASLMSPAWVLTRARPSVGLSGLRGL